MNKRWPIHSLPHFRESLSSWITRIARQYRMKRKDFIILIYGADVDVVTLNFDPPRDFVNILSEKTGLSCKQVYEMTARGSWWPVPMPLGSKPTNIHSSLIDYSGRK